MSSKHGNTYLQTLATTEQYAHTGYAAMPTFFRAIFWNKKAISP
jgi:hypothetical protein